jgi:two-component system CheB/CheR fusion protein
LSSDGNERVLIVLWRERDGAAPADRRSAAGFGTTLIENAIPSAKVSREFLPEGLLCRIEVPLSETANHDGSAQT